MVKGDEMYYLIKDNLTIVDREKLKEKKYQYVAVLTSEEWSSQKESFDMVMDIEPDITEIHSTKAEVNIDSLTGSFCIPDRDDLSAETKFAFALDEKGIVFIDDSGLAEKIVERVRCTKKCQFPSLERFLYDFIGQIIRVDRDVLEKYERRLDALEAIIEDEKGEDETTLEQVNDVRTEIRDLRIHYEQLLDFGQELEENENSFFKHENLRYFRLMCNRIDRLLSTSRAISDHTIQLRDMYKSHLDIKQNRIMTILTIVTTIFMPLTLIVGWYGMNFKYMPELEMKAGYPIVIIASILIVVVSLIYFKWKKWL